MPISSDREWIKEFPKNIKIIKKIIEEIPQPNPRDKNIFRNFNDTLLFVIRMFIAKEEIINGIIINIGKTINDAISIIWLLTF